MALKSLSFPTKSQKSPSGWGLCPHTPSVIRLSCNSLFSKRPKLDNFRGKNLLMAQFPSSTPWLRFWSHLLLATDGFFKRLYGPHTKRTKKRCWRYVSLFFRHEYEIFKIAHNLYEPSKRTAKQRFRYSDFVTKWGFGQDGSGDSKNTFRIALLSQSALFAVSLSWTLICSRKISVFLCESSVYFGPPTLG